MDKDLRRISNSQIKEGLRLAGIPATLRVALDEEHFVKALREGLGELMQKKELTPVLHVSALGDEKGIELSDGRFIEWNVFGQITAALNGQFGGELLLCVSSCNSFNCARHALKGTNPWKVIVGNTGEPIWNDTIVAFSAFYHLLAKGKTIQEAVQVCAPRRGTLISSPPTRRPCKPSTRNWPSCRRSGGSGSLERLHS